MKFIIDNWYLLVVALASGSMLLWPSLRSRGGVLATGQLVDLLDGMAADAVDTVARGATALADERRLFLVACTRARSRLLVTAVEDVPALMDKVHDAAARFREAGVCKVWVYRAFDDGHEVLILQQIENEAAARRWIDHPDAAAEWMSAAGFGVYPTVFVGTLAHITSIEAAD